MNFILGIFVTIYSYWVYSFVLENVWVWHMVGLTGVTISQLQFIGIGITGRCLKSFCWGNIGYADASRLIADGKEGASASKAAIWSMYLMALVMPWVLFFWGWVLQKVVY